MPSLRNGAMIPQSRSFGKRSAGGAKSLIPREQVDLRSGLECAKIAFYDEGSGAKGRDRGTRTHKERGALHVEEPGNGVRKMWHVESRRQGPMLALQRRTAQATRAPQVEKDQFTNVDVDRGRHIYRSHHAL